MIGRSLACRDAAEMRRRLMGLRRIDERRHDHDAVDADPLRPPAAMSDRESGREFGDAGDHRHAAARPHPSPSPSRRSFPSASAEQFSPTVPHTMRPETPSRISASITRRVASRSSAEIRVELRRNGGEDALPANRARHAGAPLRALFVYCIKSLRQVFLSPGRPVAPGRSVDRSSGQGCDPAWP